MDDDINAYLSSGAIFNKISDITRVVDPLRKRVIEHKNKEVSMDGIHCFDFWGKNKVCDNCISMRAYNDNTTYVKIEYSEDKTYMITAVPHDLSDRRVVIEIIKDITSSMFFGSAENAGIEQAGVHALIDNLNRLAFSDPLTGMYNRRYIIEKLPVDLLNAVLLSKEMSIIMVDIDFFKAVNDNYGHLAGDQVLKKVAETLSDSMKRGSDWIARYGGEEFLVCMPGAGLETAKATAEYMRKSLEKSVIQFDGKEFSITASFGVYCIKSTGGEKVEDLLKHADEKLYLAKRNGRNRIEY
ncbi:diguanylate cyclase (GGDEF) domain-containing protein [Parasporobacterium paucivorans DSM 15970]|uniref:Diguanylate cyclase (GGDEF) domain-containing protein n=2 Tax=Parasporobacterium TaxID=115543 RepID=A0A1M6HWM8_9FIRM|nr:diguanylate cyclase (GGDEF) domain-containing protein [Parasporobacterium paucivorans DSM 15970]